MPQGVTSRRSPELGLVSIDSAFSSRAQQHPERVALECDDRQLTYGELAAWSDRIARRLRAAGVRPGDIVGLYLHRSPEAIAAILGVLKARGAYLPLDLSYPDNLLAHICETSAPALMLSKRDLREDFEARGFWNGPRLLLDSGLDEEPWEGAALPHASSGDDLAYVMFTSGSTGRHKGVMVPHRAVLRLVTDANYARLDADEVFLQLAPLSFDASTFEIWGPLLNGAKLAIVASAHPSLDDIAAAIARHRVSTLWLTAGLFHLMVDYRLEALAPLRQLLAGGDVLSPRHVERALSALPNIHLINGYGPTENTTFTCCHRITREDCAAGTIPIGRPISGTEIHVLDESLQPVPDGAAGELCAGGAGLALGYLKRPDLTTERFVQSPFDGPGVRLYRTGDRVRRRADGALEFLGRVDRQVKIDGKRVELDEIEACLRSSGLVGDAAAVCANTADGRRAVAAYVTPAEGQGGSLERLREHLRRELPVHMMPASLTVLDRLPLSATGKVDRSALPAPATARPAQDSPTPCAPRSTEAVLLAIWREVLGREAIGVNDNFFDLGGTSMQLLKVHAAITARLSSDLTVVDMFRYPKISALVSRINCKATPRHMLLNARERARRSRSAINRGLVQQSSARR